MSQVRFQLVEVLNRGRKVAHIRDTKAGRDLYIHRPAQRYLHWDRMDAPVENAALRRVAREALGVGA